MWLSPMGHRLIHETPWYLGVIPLGRSTFEDSKSLSEARMRQSARAAFFLVATHEHNDGLSRYFLACLANNWYRSTQNGQADSPFFAC